MEEGILEILIERYQNADAVILIPINRPTELSTTDFRKEVVHLVNIFGLMQEHKGSNVNISYEKGRYDGHPDWIKHETALWPGKVGIHYTSYTVYFSNEAAEQRFINEVNTHPEFGYKARIPSEPGFLETLTNVKRLNKD